MVSTVAHSRTRNFSDPSSISRMRLLTVEHRVNLNLDVGFNSQREGFDADYASTNFSTKYKRSKIESRCTITFTSFVICVTDPGASAIPSTVGSSPQTCIGIRSAVLSSSIRGLQAPWILTTLYFIPLIWILLVLIRNHQVIVTLSLNPSAVMRPPQALGRPSSLHLCTPSTGLFNAAVARNLRTSANAPTSTEFRERCRSCLV